MQTANGLARMILINNKKIHFTESTIEEAALEWLKNRGYTIIPRNDSFKQVIINKQRG
jgi:hypothetical protein